MKTPIAILAAVLLAPCACTRHQPPPQPAVQAEPIDPGPAAEARPAPTPAPVAEPDPQPTPEEVAAFHAPVPK